jgi:hypothetical protein
MIRHCLRTRSVAFLAAQPFVVTSRRPRQISLEDVRLMSRQNTSWRRTVATGERSGRPRSTSWRGPPTHKRKDWPRARWGASVGTRTCTVKQMTAGMMQAAGVGDDAPSVGQMPPAACIIHCVRDPRDVVTPTVKAGCRRGQRRGNLHRRYDRLYQFGRSDHGPAGDKPGQRIVAVQMTPPTCRSERACDPAVRTRRTQCG